MGRGKSTRWGVLAAAGGAAVVVLLLVVAVLGQEAAQTAPLRATPTPTPETDPAAVVVNDQPIGVNFWAEAVLVDRVMSGLAGVAASQPEETLERLVRGVLVVQAAPQEPPTGEEVETYIAALETAWGMEDEQVVAALNAAGLDREALVRTATRLLVVQRAQEELQAEGTSFEDWLKGQQEQAEIVYHRERMQVVLQALAPAAAPSLSPTPVPSTLPTPVPTPTAVSGSPLSQAPDFTLERAGGGGFTLSEQLARGPVVLVFFQKCG